MKVGDLVVFNENHYPEYKGSFGVLAEKKAANSLSSEPMWKVFVQNRMHSFYVHTHDLEVVGYDEDKMIGGEL